MEIVPSSGSVLPELAPQGVVEQSLMSGHRWVPPAFSLVQAQARQIPNQGPCANSWLWGAGGERQVTLGLRGIGMILLTPCLASAV